MRLLTEAACWQIADAAVRQHDSPAMRAFPLGEASATAAVLDLAGELAEHLRDLERHRAVHARSDRIGRGHVGTAGAAKPVQDVLDRQRGRLALLPLVRAYAERKRDLEAMDFGDQLRRAAIVAREHPEVGEAERDRFRIVLLDEYQDTSTAQVVLLRSLFGRRAPVTAVGDPCQSIYGWRGASAGTLDRFPDGLPAGPSGAPADGGVAHGELAQRAADPRRRQRGLRSRCVASACQSSRCGRRVQPARTARRRSGAVRAAGDVPRTRPTWIADQVERVWRTERPAPPTTAVLVRARAQIAALEAGCASAACRSRWSASVACSTPPRCGTWCAPCRCSPIRPPAPRCCGCSPARAGASAVAMSWRCTGGPAIAGARARLSGLMAERPGAGAGPRRRAPRRRRAAEALDDLGRPERYSAEGHARFLAFRDELRELRRRLDQSLPDLVADIAQTIGLDVEVAVRGGGSGAAGLARAHLDAIGDVAARFAEETEGGTLSAFLSYLAAAEEEERGLPPGEVEVVEGAVQILTVHAAKGLEWDVVAVAGLCEDAFPDPPKAQRPLAQGHGRAALPAARGRRRPARLDLTKASDGKGVRDAIEAFDDAWREHQEREERRLAYVAVTRPRHLLLVLGHSVGRGSHQAARAVGLPAGDRRGLSRRRGRRSRRGCPTARRRGEPDAGRGGDGGLAARSARAAA